MARREKVINGLAQCILTRSQNWCDSEKCPYWPTTDCMYVLMQDALWLLENQADEYAQWAKNNEAKTCATCGRQSEHVKGRWTRCLIEKVYALPCDGHCHLWEPIKKREDEEE